MRQNSWIRWGVCLLMLGSVIVAAEFSPPPAAEIEGLDSELKSRIETLSAAIAENPQDGLALAGLAQTCEAAGLMDWAEQAYREVLRIDPNNARMHHYLARLLEQRGKLVEAIEGFETVHRLAPDYVPAYVLHGRLLFEQGAYVDAEAILLDARKRDPDNVAARVGVAQVALRNSEPDTVITLLEPLLGTRKVDRSLVQTLARAYQMVGRTEDARQSVSNLMALPVREVTDPWNDERPRFQAGFGADLLRSEGLFNDGYYDEAVAVLEILLRKQPDNLTVMNNLSVAYRRAGRAERAIAIMTEGSERHPDYFPLQMNLASYYESRSDSLSALKHLTRAIEIHPGLAVAHERMGGILMRARNDAAAYESFNKAATLGDRAHTSLFAGQLALQLGRNDEAVAHLEESTRRDSEEIVAWLSLSQALVTVGRIDDADQALSKARALNADHPQIDKISYRIESKRSAAGAP